MALSHCKYSLLSHKQHRRLRCSYRVRDTKHSSAQSAALGIPGTLFVPIIFPPFSVPCWPSYSIISCHKSPRVDVPCFYSRLFVSFLIPATATAFEALPIVYCCCCWLAFCFLCCLLSYLGALALPKRTCKPSLTHTHNRTSGRGVGHLWKNTRSPT